MSNSSFFIYSISPILRRYGRRQLQFTQGPNYILRYGRLFVAGRLEQDGPYDGPDWGGFFKQFSLISPSEFPRITVGNSLFSAELFVAGITGPAFVAFGRVISWNQVVNRYLHTTEIRLMRQGTADLMRIVGNKLFKTKS